MEAITLGADVGGRDADAATHDHILRLRKLLAAEWVGPYGTLIDELGLVLRIDGSVQAWERTGVDAVVIRNGRRVATADIYIPREAWARQDAGAYFCNLLAANVKAAVEAIVRQAHKKKVDVQQDALFHDLDMALSKFLERIAIKVSESEPDEMNFAQNPRLHISASLANP